MILGVTGLMGSGKSHVCNELRSKYGAIIFDSDQEAKGILHWNYIKEKIIALFGKDCYDSNGMLDVVYLRNIVFNDDFELRVLESIVHPEVLKLFHGAKSYMNTYMDKNDILVLESALLYKIGWEKYVDKVVWVDVPFWLRKTRVMERDGITSEEFMKRSLKQPLGNKDMLRADYIVNNYDMGFDLTFMEDL